VLEWIAYGFGATTPNVDRQSFNHFLRGISSLVELVSLLAVVSAGAEGVASERARATWDGLLATPLDGREVLRAKMIGAAWKARWGVVLLIALWSAGLLAGSLHPLGVAAAVLVLGVSTWFMAALGTYASLVARDVAQAATWTTVLVPLLAVSFLACYMPAPTGSILMGTGSLPLVNWLCLVSYGDVREAIGQGTFNLQIMGIFTDEGPLRVAATCLLGTTGYAIGAAWLTRSAFARFDRVVGRPERAPAAVFGRHAPIPPAELAVIQPKEEREPARVG
jgi:hypothetical protein